MRLIVSIPNSQGPVGLILKQEFELQDVNVPVTEKHVPSSAVSLIRTTGAAQKLLCIRSAIKRPKTIFDDTFPSVKSIADGQQFRGIGNFRFWDRRRIIRFNKFSWPAYPRARLSQGGAGKPSHPVRRCYSHSPRIPKVQGMFFPAMSPGSQISSARLERHPFDPVVRGTAHPSNFYGDADTAPLRWRSVPKDTRGDLPKTHSEPGHAGEDSPNIAPGALSPWRTS